MSGNLSDDVLVLLRCPVSGQSLKQVEADDLKSFGVDFPEGGFLTEDGSRAYPIEGGFPVLKAGDSVTIGDEAS